MKVVGPTRQKLIRDAEEKRRAFGESVRALREGKIPYLDRTSELPQSLIDSCRLVQNRLEMVKLLPANAVVAEIGTDEGNFARYLLDTCMPKELHIFEIDVARIKPDNLRQGREKGIVTVHEGDSSELIGSMPDGYFDWIYIDGDHLYEGVKRDILAAAPKVKEGGLLVFNDYATWSPTSMSHCGVARAVNEFCIEDDWELVYLAFQTMMYNDVAIRRRR